MTTHLQTAIILVKTLSLLLGGAITFFALKAYRRTGAPALRALTIGFAVVTLGAMGGGAVDLLTDLDLVYGILLESALTLVGFAVITYSLYVE